MSQSSIRSYGLTDLSTVTQINNDQLIQKILQLENQLYETNIQNQKLRQEHNRLSIQYNHKKNMIFPTKSIKNIKKGIKRNSSQQLFACFGQSEKNTPKYSQTPSTCHTVQPITGLEQSFQRFKINQTNKSSFSSQSTSRVSSSSSRTIGIHKNIGGKSQVSQFSEASSPTSAFPFKSIEQIWNGKGQSFLKKKAPSNMKKKSYLT